MQRLTISISDDLASQFDAWMERKHYQNRSEAFRDLVRQQIAQSALMADSTSAVGILSYSFDHHVRQLSNRMVEHQHHHTSLIISTTHIHIDEDHCIETVLMRGTVGAIKSLAAQMTAETGIENGQLNLFPAAPQGHAHSHEHDHDHEEHHHHSHGESSHE